MEVLENLVDTLELDEITSDDSRNILQNFTMEEVRDVILPFEWNLEKSTLVLKVLDQMTESDPEISSNDAEIIRKLACINYQVLVSYRFCTDSSHRDIRSLRLICKLLSCMVSICAHAGSGAIGVCNTNTLQIILWGAQLLCHSIYNPKSISKLEISNEMMDGCDDIDDDDTRQDFQNELFQFFRSLFVKDFFDIVVSRNEEFLIDALFETILSLYLLVHLRHELSDLQSVATSLITRFSHLSQRNILKLFQTISPVLLMTIRDSSILPDEDKLRCASHRYCCALVCQILDGFFDENNKNEESLSITSFLMTCCLGLLQRMAIVSSERAAIRALIYDGIVKILENWKLLLEMKNNSNSAPNEILKEFGSIVAHRYLHFIHFLYRMSRSSKPSLRSYAVEIASFLLRMSWNAFFSQEFLEKFSTTIVIRFDEEWNIPMILVVIVLLRSSDVQPTVRLRSISALAELLQTCNNNDLFAFWKEILWNLALGSRIQLKELSDGIGDGLNSPFSGKNTMEVDDNDNNNWENKDERSYDDNGWSPEPNISNSRRSLSPLQSSSSSSSSSSSVQNINLLEILKKRVEDIKPLIKSKAIQAYISCLSMPWSQGTMVEHVVPQSSNSTPSKEIFQHEKSLLVTEEDISLVVSACAEPKSISIRKQGIQSLTFLLLSRPLDSRLHHAWVNAVLTAITDVEASVQEKVAQAVYEVLWQGVLNFAKQQNNSTNHVQNSNILMWDICETILVSNKTSLLTECIQYAMKIGMIASDVLIASSETKVKNGSLKCHSKELIDSILKACELEDMILSEKVHSNHRYQIERVVQGGWMLFECILNVENRKQPSSEHSSSKASNSKAKNRNHHLSHFVIQRLLLRHSSANLQDIYEKYSSLQTSSSSRTYFSQLPCKALVLDDNDLRIFSVLKHLLNSLTTQDLLFLQDFLTTILMRGGSMIVLPRLISTVIPFLSAVFHHLYLVVLNKPDEYINQFKNWIRELLSLSHYSLLSLASRRIPSSDFLLFNTTTESSQAAAAAASATTVLSSFHFILQHVDGSSVLENMLALACRSLSIIGEIAMLGFSVEEDENKISLLSCEYQHEHTHLGDLNSNVGWKVLIPTSIMQLIQLFMGEGLPTIGHDIQRDNHSTSAHEFHVNVRWDDVESDFPHLLQRLRATAFVTLGKLCLRSQQLARSQVNIFLRELVIHRSDEKYDSTEAVRSNALLILGDLCVRYTNLIDRHIGLLASCLQSQRRAFIPAQDALTEENFMVATVTSSNDSVCQMNINSPLVRRHAFVLLSQLLLQDYLKWRGMLLFRFLATIVDEDIEFSEFAKEILKRTFLTRGSESFQDHLGESVVVFNDCREHPIYKAAEALGSEGANAGNSVDMEGIDLSGSKNQKKRLRIYAYMLDELSDEQKIQVTAKLVNDILSHAVDILSCESQSKQFHDVVEDTILILQSPLLRIGRRSAGNEATDDLENLDNETASSMPSNGNMDNKSQKLIRGAKLKVLNILSKQHLVSHIVPVIFSLKHIFQRTKSTLQGTLMQYLIFLSKTHKAEMDEVLSKDPIMKAEIEYDLREFSTKNKSNNGNGMHNSSNGNDISPSHTTLRNPSSLDIQNSVRKVLRSHEQECFTSPSFRISGTPKSTISVLRNSLSGQKKTPSQLLSIQSNEVEFEDDLADRLTASSTPQKVVKRMKM